MDRSVEDESSLSKAHDQFPERVQVRLHRLKVKEEGPFSQRKQVYLRLEHDEFVAGNFDDITTQYSSQSPRRQLEYWVHFYMNQHRSRAAGLFQTHGQEEKYRVMNVGGLCTCG
ncbi:hypothetical protein AYO21_07513 [Fonsecaea monophora]|uniref:Uncharacterized protein n=1 Tax=Fonsecaea monophora TaxID=254056 RepID=A0A177F1T6_9EURO|nr:hypothetical protein AYO21_07513 [Fonsecaea monophora]KAH0830048.1 hypothetical protein FOPE_10881 [Fonsecaea pedrosoi]OAG38287.1 hypothetical protein AYO21_07513 [Fonsecaea monophora]